MKIYIGSDHAGFELKKNIIDNYNTLNLFQDCGCFNKNSVDYPDIAKIVCDNINKDLRNEEIIIDLNERNIITCYITLFPYLHHL